MAREPKVERATVTKRDRDALSRPLQQTQRGFQGPAPLVLARLVPALWAQAAWCWLATTPTEATCGPTPFNGSTWMAVRPR